MIMPWQETDKFEEKFKFILDWKKNEFSFSHLCKRFKISRTTGYIIINNYQSEGIEGLKEKSKQPNSSPHKTDEEIEAKLIELKHRYPYWGPVKIKDFIIAEGLKGEWPAPSTIGEIFKRHGLVKARKKRLRVAPYTNPLKHCTSPNAVWSADFKGQFKLKNNRYCYPLTITDNFSRYLLACDAFLSPNCNDTIKTFTRVFGEFGLPDAIRTDNGQPFCGVGFTSLTRLSIWFLKLGILPERINVGAPQENGRHERMHRTLKEAAIVNCALSLNDQQKKFNNFIEEYNDFRPHTALSGKRPSETYVKSLKEFPEKIPEIDYPSHFNLRRVKHNGEIMIRNKRFYLSELLYGETIGLEKIDDERSIIYFSKMKLGIVDIRVDKIIRP